ncbi:MAG: RNA-processing protein [Candidatus Diapherotrites archaeon CG08_land_8_20_14_0_20_34_12]|nr:MAG: RNA-processing protein [Candidatus Diapherotrites archaeon CG08_land_8_20_14_0_20_34_12]
MFDEEQINVPKDRIAALIGKVGSTKKQIEELTKSKLNIDSKTGEVLIENKDVFMLHKTEEIVKAIARGFSPEKSLLLLDEEFFMDIIPLKEIIGKSEKEIHTKKARVIGRQGTIRAEIEEKTGTYISVYGNTIGIIGNALNMDLAKQAIEMLLNGAKIESMRVFLDKRISKSKEFKL